MKILFIPILFISALSFTFSKKEFIPPGTVKYNDTLFIDETEISNFSWKEYEYWIKNKFGKNSIEHLAVIPDTLVWVQKNRGFEPYTSLYYWHPAFRNYPVVGVSYDQILGFCQWRTERVKDFISISKKNYKIDFEYRLPTRKEWEMLSYNGNYIMTGDGTNGKGKPIVNVLFDSDTTSKINENEIKKDIPEILVPIKSFDKNFFGLYNMIGNVSEMVLEKGISKGGSWQHKLEQCRVGKNIEYSKPEAWLGFRCVCVVKRSKI